MFFFFIVRMRVVVNLFHHAGSIAKAVLWATCFTT